MCSEPEYVIVGDQINPDYSLSRIREYLVKWSDGGTDDALVMMAGHVQELDEHISNGGDLPDGWARSSP